MDTQQPVAPEMDAETLRFQRFLYAAHISTPKLFVTKSIVAVNVAIYLWMVLTGHALFGSETMHPFLEAGANFAPHSLTGEWWRLLTAMFLHGPLFHVGLNMWVLWSEGAMVERLIGRSGYAVLYLGSGLLGSLASAYFNPSAPSIGASGAIFGVIGALFALLYVHRHQFPRAMRLKMVKSSGLFILLNIVFFFSVPQIDLAAHVGGGLAGAAGGFFLAHPLTRQGIKRRRPQTLRLLTLSTALISIAFLAYPMERIDVPLGVQTLRPVLVKMDGIQKAYQTSWDTTPGDHSAEATRDRTQRDAALRLELQDLLGEVRALRPRSKTGRGIQAAMSRYLALYSAFSAHLSQHDWRVSQSDPEFQAITQELLVAKKELEEALPQ